MTSTIRRCPTCRRPGPDTELWCPACNPRPHPGNPAHPNFQCPTCGRWHQVDFGSQIASVHCLCIDDPHGVLVWQTSPR